MGVTNGNDPQYRITVPTVETQVCVIGSGPAGITAAWYLQKAGIKVTLIEGSRDFGDNYTASWPDKKLLYCGVAEGLFKENECDFLIRPYGEVGSPWERERVFGGTSNHWGGQCRPLDPITFEQRIGFPGWPIKRPDLDPYYAEACAFLNLVGDYYDGDKKGGLNFTTAYWAPRLKGEDPKLEGFDTEMYQFLGGDSNFATRKFDDGNHKKTIGETDVNVILNATLLDIDHDSGFVRRLHVASMDESSPPHVKQEFFIHADAYVLACGAVANARQLLLSNAGNEHDLVGRYFMCHPFAPGTAVTITKTFLNVAEQALMAGGGWTDPTTGVSVQGRFSLTAEAQRMCGTGSCWFWAGGGPYLFEMAPNCDSCVTLDGTPIRSSNRNRP